MQFTDKVVDIAVVAETDQIPAVLVVQAPLLPFVEKIALIPEIRTVLGTRTSESADAESVQQAFMKGFDHGLLSHGEGCF